MNVNTDPLDARVNSTLEVLHSLADAIEALPALMTALAQTKDHLKSISGAYARLDEHELDCLPTEVKTLLRHLTGLSTAALSAVRAHQDLETFLVGVGLMEKP